MDVYSNSFFIIFYSILWLVVGIYYGKACLPSDKPQNKICKVLRIFFGVVLLLIGGSSVLVLGFAMYHGLDSYLQIYSDNAAPAAILFLGGYLLRFKPSGISRLQKTLKAFGYVLIFVGIPLYEVIFINEFMNSIFSVVFIGIGGAIVEIIKKKEKKQYRNLYLNGEAKADIDSYLRSHTLDQFKDNPAIINCPPELKNEQNNITNLIRIYAQDPGGSIRANNFFCQSKIILDRIFTQVGLSNDPYYLRISELIANCTIFFLLESYTQQRDTMETFSKNASACLNWMSSFNFTPSYRINVYNDFCTAFEKMTNC